MIISLVIVFILIQTSFFKQQELIFQLIPRWSSNSLV